VGERLLSEAHVGENSSAVAITPNVNLFPITNPPIKNAQNAVTLWQSVSFVKKRYMNALNANTKKKRKFSSSLPKPSHLSLHVRKNT
jgi:hypothetical protein